MAWAEGIFLELGKPASSRSWSNGIAAREGRRENKPPNLVRNWRGWRSSRRRIRDRRGRGPGCRGALIVRTAGQPCKAFFFQEKGDGHGAPGVSLRLKGITDIVNGEVLLPQRNDVVAHRIPF